MEVSNTAIRTVNTVIFVVHPLILTVGVVGNTVSCAVFYRKRNIVGFYLQFFARLVDLMSCLASFGSYMESHFRLSMNNTRTEYAYILSNYDYMWYAAHLQFVLTSTCTTVVLFISLLQCMDRIWQLRNPLAYFEYCSTKKQWLIKGAIVLCFLVAILVNVYDSFRLYIVKVGDNQFGLRTTPNFYTPFVTFLVYLRTAVRCFGAILLLLGNCIVFALTQRFKTQQIAWQVDDEFKRRLTFLSVLYLIQAVLQCAAHVGVSIGYLVIAFAPSFAATNLAQTLSSAALFTVVFSSISLSGVLFVCLSKEFRRMLFDTMKDIEAYICSVLIPQGSVVPYS